MRTPLTADVARLECLEKIVKKAILSRAAMRPERLEFREK